ncbi:uncharacterized protein (UPF0335 family) [Cytobacillus horneckiae]|nr:hypothetical protein [Cytobacillus horneckiae]MBN6887275.1 hypothetical protein [Cytobacillus horneckiae]
MKFTKRFNQIKDRIERLEEHSVNGYVKLNVFTLTNDIEWLCHVVHLQQEEIERLEKENSRYFQALNQIEPIHNSGKVKQIAREALGRLHQ